LASNGSDQTLDFGYYKPAKLGDFVWVDTNGNGIQNSGEPGIAGVTLTLTGTTNAGGSVSATATTTSTGYYQFPNLAPGSYTVTVDTGNFSGSGALVGYTATVSNAPGSATANDSNGSPTSTSLASNGSDQTLDF